MKKPNNQQDIIKQRTYVNIGLSIVFIVLLAWVMILFYGEIRKKNASIDEIFAITKLRIERQNDTLEFNKMKGSWYFAAPYKDKASTTVIEAFLQKISTQCQPVDTSQMPRDLQFYANLNTNTAQYSIGELNTATDRVYVKTTALTDGVEHTKLCDKLVASIALAPAINFFDKQLYQGELTELRGSFGKITDFSGMDFSVLELASADPEQARKSSISDLTFVSDKGESLYRVLPPTEDGKHILLFEPKKSLIYVIASHPKVNAILGLQNSTSQ